ncbi:MAG TPA: hypothetical protein VFJ74_08650 [Gemmatimonadaceae bacterium]|nr:hypothetical protein [Gemmatimonadaceae bacterium]
MTTALPLPVGPGRAAVHGEVAGRTVVLHYGDPLAEHAALRTGAMLVDRSFRGRMRLSGPRAAEVLTGLVTNDVKGLPAGHGQYAAALTAKGKIVADLRIFAMAAPGATSDGAAPESLLIDAPPRAAAAWADMVRKYVNPRLASYRDESAALCDFGVFGAQARHAVDRAFGVGAAAIGALPPYGHVTALVDGVAVTIARVPDLEIEGFELLIPADAAPALWRRLADAGGVTPGGLVAWDVARVEAGRPEWGIDIDENTLPQEANFDELHAISYTKGCYVGQETVARVHFRGHVNRHLRGLRFEVPAAADAIVGAASPVARADDTELPPPRAPLFDESGKSVGDVRSAALSPRFGPIALAMVRRELAVGDSVVVRWGGDAGGDGATPAAAASTTPVARELRATVTALPFGR